MRLYLSSCAPATALKKKKKGYKLKVGLRVRVRVITPMFAIAPLKLRVPWESAILQAELLYIQATKCHAN